ncbi:MAG: zf-TFIIB domain-containing protein [Candidatus Eremiobacterota bacterium]
MNCPRCSVPLHTVEVHQVQVDLCSQCEGSWYDIAELGRMFAVPDREMKASELVKPGAPVDLEKPIACPRCGQEMERNRYLSGCPVLVDRCEEHGIWLDGGELSTLLNHMAQEVKKSVKGHATEDPGGFFLAIKRLFGG